jgi:hypothetical protein
VDARTPLVGESLAVDQDERGHAMRRDQGAGDDGLAGAGWAFVFAEQPGTVPPSPLYLLKCARLKERAQRQARHQ